MTNENLCEMIQDGNTELIPTLWEQTEKYFYLQARKWFNAFPDACRGAGVELDDLEQEGYFAFIDTVGYFKRNSGYKFLSFATFPIKNRFRQILGLRTDAQRKMPLNGALSIEKPIGEDDITLLDALEDKTAAAAFQGVENGIDTERLRDILDVCLNRLSPAQADVVRARYFRGMTFEDIAKQLGITYSVAVSRETEGLRKLRRGINQSDLKPWRDDIIGRASRCTGWSSWEKHRTSSVEYAVIRLDEIERQLLEKKGYL